MRRLRSIRCFAGIALAFTLLLSACEFQSLDIEDVMVDYLATAAMQDSPDQSVRAAATASNVAERVSQAELELDLGIIGKDMASINKAVTLRPRDPWYRLNKAVMQVALGEKGVEDSAGEAMALIQLERPGASGAEQERVFAEGFLLAIISTSQLLPVDSQEWQRLKNQYCFTLGTYEKSYPAGKFPSGTCPK